MAILDCCSVLHANSAWLFELAMNLTHKLGADACILLTHTNASSSLHSIHNLLCIVFYIPFSCTFSCIFSFFSLFYSVKVTTKAVLVVLFFGVCKITNFSHFKRIGGECVCLYWDKLQQKSCWSHRLMYALMYANLLSIFAENNQAVVRADFLTWFTLHFSN